MSASEPRGPGPRMPESWMPESQRVPPQFAASTPASEASTPESEVTPIATHRPSSPAAGLEPYRRRLDELDEEIALLLGERFQVCREIALFKRAHAIPMMQPDRVEQVRSRYLDRGAAVRLPGDFTAALFELLIGATCAMEDELMADEP